MKESLKNVCKTVKKIEITFKAPKRDLLIHEMLTVSLENNVWIQSDLFCQPFNIFRVPFVISQVVS